MFDLERVGELVQFALLLVPTWAVVGIAGVAVAGLLWVLIAKLRSHHQSPGAQEKDEPAREVRCRYCLDQADDAVGYFSWADFLRDTRDWRVCLKHVLARCDRGMPEQPPSPWSGVDKRIARERDRIRKKHQPVGSAPCGYCRGDHAA